MSHYYYFGRTFCPNGLERSDQKKRKFAVNAKAVLEWIANILLSNQVELEDRFMDASSSSVNGGEKAGAAPSKSSGTNFLRRGSESKDFGLQPEQADTRVMLALQDARDGKIELGEPLELSGNSPLYIEENALWTMDQFAEWADEALDDNSLNTIFYRLVGAGVLPFPSLERDVVREAWKEWQTSDVRLWSDDDSNKDGLEFFSKSVQRFFHISSGADGAVLKATSPAWGGIGGFDGKGGLGHGIMYCLDKNWWDAWAAFSGWSWDGEYQSQSLSLNDRPSYLSNETLLDRFSDFAVAGTLGSYEIMRSTVIKGVDYVLVPPGVWDVLYELYGGGPPLPRMVLPPQRMDFRPRRRTNSGDAKQMEQIDELGREEGVQVIDSYLQLMRIPEAFMVATHPWVFQCTLCDAAQPYRRGEAGSMSIRIMATPDQPLWRLYAEILVRLPIQNQRAVGSDARGRGRLWKTLDAGTSKESASRYGPWVLLCKNRSALLPLVDLDLELEEHYESLKRDWQTYTDHLTVEGCGLANGDRLMLEYAVLNKNSEFVWPREAAAKAGRVKRIADEDLRFRSSLRGVDEKGKESDKPVGLVGMSVDAMDSSGRWYPVKITQVDVFSEDDDEAENGEIQRAVENAEHERKKDRKQVKVDFSEFGGHVEWIDVESDRLAVLGRFTLNEGDDADENSDPPAAADPKVKTAASGKKATTETTEHNVGKICTLPGYGACGLANLGNTCYANSAIQCISYMPLLRSYLLSGQYKAMGDLNKDNPLGTGGKLLEEFSDLLRIMWSGKSGERSPTKFRAQLGKQRSQFSGADQQDAQELLNYMLDVLHEDSNRVKKKPYVEALEDDWVKMNSLPRVGEEAWRRFLRRNRSVMADVAMGQVLNTVTCPVCHFSSRIFDPFNLLSIPFPTVADVVFQCTVVRRATPLNCPKVLNAPRKHREELKRYNIDDMDERVTQPPSERLLLEEYVIPMSRLADIADLRLRLQGVSGIPAARLRLCKAEDFMNMDLDDINPVKRHTRVTTLPDKEGPCVQVAKSAGSTDEIGATPPTPTRIFAFEHTLSPRPMPVMEGRVEDDEDTVTDEDDDEDEDAPQDEKNSSTRALKELKILRELVAVYGDGRECRIYDTDSLPISKAISRSLWPRAEDEFKLGLRVDAIDHRDHWFPGSVVEIIEGVANDDEDDSPPIENVTKTKVRIHFDNFSSKWDETYTIDHFKRGKVRPLYSHATPRPKPTEFMVHHRFYDKDTDSPLFFGQAFFLQCQNEWSTARAGAHILAQASRYFQKANVDHTGPIDVDEIQDADSKVLKLYERAQMAISELIDLLLDCDRAYVRAALGVAEGRDDFRNPAFDATSMSAVLVKKVGALLHRLPFELKVCTADSLIGQITNNSAAKSNPGAEEVPFPFSLMRTIGNYMNARHAVVLHWRDPPQADKRSRINLPVMYVPPTVGLHQSSLDLLQENGNKYKKGGNPGGNSSDANSNDSGSGGLHLGVCLTEFCKMNQLNLNDNWRCPRCKEYREGKQNMNLWRLPDLLTFHLKRFNCSARWREKITTKVNFPLTGLDMSEWCHPESPALQSSQVYDLIAVVNHFGGMTGGHYVATCKATPCTPTGSEEVGHPFPGVGSCRVLGADEGLPTSKGWRIRKDKDNQNQSKVNAARQVCASAEALWLQFDDDLVEPIPPRNVVSEMAYVLFYKRRHMTPSNIVKYCTLD
jgi:ubiquitin C-terminal hydrolase